MVSNGKYPKLVIDLSKLKNNIEKVRIMCQDKGVEIAGVITVSYTHLTLPTTPYV